MIIGLSNSLWAYTISTQTWEHLTGDPLVPNVNTDFVNSLPGSSYDHAMVLSYDGELLYLFGGRGYIGGTLRFLDNLWAYAIQNGTWTHLKGSMTGDSSPSTSSPGAMYEHSMVLSNNGSYLYVFGGKGESGMLTFRHLY